MATVAQPVPNGPVTIIITVQERGPLRAALARGVSDQHDDFVGTWLVILESDWVEFTTQQGNAVTLHEQNDPGTPISQGDAKQLQDLLGEMRESDPAWNSTLDELDSKIHNLWLAPHDQFPVP